MHLKEFAREMVKVSGIREAVIQKPEILKGIITALAAGGAASAAAYAGLPKNVKKQMSKEVRDPRLYSNLRGMATLESAKERVRAHRRLAKNKGGGVLSAMRKGFLRSKS